MPRDTQKQIVNRVSGSNHPNHLQYMDTLGTGLGTTNANGDYSAAQEIFFTQPPVNEIYVIRRMLIQIRDATPLSAETYGAVALLTNGVQVRVQDDSGTIADLTAGLPVQSNADWGRLCYDADVMDFGAGDNYVKVRWTFANGGKLIELNGNRNERLEVLLDDDLTGLVGHHFLLHGFRIA